MMTEMNMWCFCNVVNHMSFSAAADDLMMSRQAISRHVKMLEDSLNTTLISRQANSFTLTRAGVIYYNMFNRFFDELVKAKEAFSTESGSQPVRVGILRTLPQWEQLPLAAEYCRSLGMSPDLRITVMEAMDIEIQLKEGSLDLGLAMPLPIIRHQEQYGHFLYDFMRQVLLLSEDSPLLKEGLSREELIQKALSTKISGLWGKPEVIINEYQGYVNNWRESGYSIKDVKHYANMDSAVMAAQRDECVFIAPASPLVMQLPGLVKIDLNKELDYYCIWSTEFQNPCVEAFVRYLQRHYQHELYPKFSVGELNLTPEILRFLK